MSIVLTPSAASSNSDLSLVVDLVKAQKAFENNGKSFIVLSKFRFKKSGFKLVLSGEVSTDGIKVSTFGEGKSAKSSYSFGFVLDSPEDVEAIGSFQALVDGVCPEDYESSSLIKDETMYIKLKTKDGKRFSCFSNVKLDPKKSHEAAVYNGQKVSITAELSAWFNLEDKKAGLTLNVTKLEFEVEADEPAAKRVKV